MCRIAKWALCRCLVVARKGVGVYLLTLGHICRDTGVAILLAHDILGRPTVVGRGECGVASPRELYAVGNRGERYIYAITAHADTEADNTLVVFLRQKSDGALLRLSFADQRHLTGYILTDSNGIVTDGVLSDPDGITPEEHLRAAYQSATATGVALPDYKGRELTQEELDYFAELFQWNPQDPTTFRYNYVLASTFTTAENCNMKYFFYDGLGYERDDPITDEEIQYLQDNGYDYWKGETHRLPADRVEQLLMDYFGLTPDQAWFTLPYNPNTDCYYIFHTDTLGQITQKFCKGYYDVLTGITTLYYPGYSFSPGHIVTLKDQPGNEAVPYRVLSHLFAAERE